MSNLQNFKNNNVTINDVLLYLENEQQKPQIEFPFDSSLSGNPNEILTKILFINYWESTRIKNIDINELKIHIESILCEQDYKTICKGVLNDDYYSVVNKIAFGHGIKTRPPTEDNLTSFASKFCGSHNQKAPFWDNLVSDLLKYLEYKHERRNYREYVLAFKKLKEENHFNKYSLREIERAMWGVAKKSI